MEELAAVFKALSHPHRLAILDFLRRNWPAAGAACCSNLSASGVMGLARELGLAPSTISHHIKELRQAGLLVCTRSGVNVSCCVNRARLAALAAYLDETPEPAGQSEKPLNLLEENL